MIKQTIVGEDYIHDLISVTFEVTYACDKKCSYCYNPIPRFNGAKDDVKNAVWQKLMSIKTPLQILLLGGETTFYKHTVDYWNEYVTTYMDDPTHSINLYTHGNNKPEVYEKFIGGKKHAYLGFSYHPGQTDEELYFKNIELVRKNGVNVVVCLVTSNDKTEWPHAKSILERVTELGCQTQIEFCVKTDNSRDATADAYDYFDEYLYQCYKIKELHFTGDENLVIYRDHYNREFVNGLSNVKKLCKNRTFSIDPNCRLTYECKVGGIGLDLSRNLDRFEEFIAPRHVNCTQQCPSIVATLNEKVFFAKTIAEIKA